MNASDTPLTSDNDTETCENRNGRRGAGNTTDGLTHHSPLTRRRAVVSVSPDTHATSSSKLPVWSTTVSITRAQAELIGGSTNARQATALCRTKSRMSFARALIASGVETGSPEALSRYMARWGGEKTGNAKDIAAATIPEQVILRPLYGSPDAIEYVIWPRPELAR